MAHRKHRFVRVEDLQSIDCAICGRVFDPFVARWKCPHCKFKSPLFRRVPPEVALKPNSAAR